MPTYNFRAFHKRTLLLPVVFAMVFCAAFSSIANGQAVAEAAGATSVSAGVASSIKAPPFPSMPATAAASTSPHLTASSGPPPEDTNRKMLESRSGKDAGKLLLRALPVEAQIWINGQIVGKTPLLLVLAPGKYQIEMRGARGQTGRRSVDLLPRETREVAVKLDQLYPGRVTAQR
jgi:PEGA domain